MSDDQVVEQKVEGEVTSAVSEEKSSKKEKPKAWTKDWFLHETWSWIYIFFIVFGFRSTFIDHYHIPTGSLLPTNAIGDSIVVNKMSYGFKVPFSEFFGTYSDWLGLDERWEPVYITEQTIPERGDIVVFEYPQDKSILFVKRTIGIPGDVIEIFDNELYLNGEKIEREVVKDDKEYRELYDPEPGFDPASMVFYRQTIGEKTFITAQDSRKKPDPPQKYIVPEGTIFVLGDNRDFSADSRYWGFVPLELVRGRAFMVWMSLVYPWSSKPFHFRPSRIGTQI